MPGDVQTITVGMRYSTIEEKQQEVQYRVQNEGSRIQKGIKESNGEIVFPNDSFEYDANNNLRSLFTIRKASGCTSYYDKKTGLDYTAKKGESSFYTIIDSKNCIQAIDKNRNGIVDKGEIKPFFA